MAGVTVRLPDGSTKEFVPGTTAREFAESIGPRLAKAAVAATFDGVPVDLSRPLEDGAEVTVVTATTPLGREILRHSTAHVLAQAVLRLWPGAHFAIGPVIEDGFYYDFELPGGAHFTDEDLDRIAAEMRAIMAEDQPFVRREHSIAEGLELFGDQPFKREIIEAVGAGQDEVDAASEGAGEHGVSTYWNSPAFTDLCRGPHVPSTAVLGHFALMRVAGAYWRGDEKRQQLQRIYGTAWESDAAVAEHLHRLEEAEKRDHRRLGVELDLFSFPHELGGGLAVWHPQGGIVRRLMEDYSRERHAAGGYEFVFTPHLANGTLFETSGHLDFYRDGMYPPMEMDNGTYYPKPMNCPMHCLIFGSRQRSYRELPLRLFELGTVYRYERAGTLHGLMRIRGFTQDDSHIFCTEDQLQDEIVSLLGFVMSVLSAFGFTEFTANLSTKDPEKYVGGDAIWDTATEALRLALETAGLPYEVKEGDAAFYGPKIDIDVRDAIGRTWQLSTIQCDFNHPERFDLQYVGADNARHRPIMLHRALFGSIERFFAILVEHYAGALPTWLAPEQVRVLGVRDDHQGYAEEVAAGLRSRGVRVGVAVADEPIGARIRRAKLLKIPYILVVGDDDVAAGTVGVNRRGGQRAVRDVPVTTFAEGLVQEIADRTVPEGADPAAPGGD
jgi:threonyl-tRNA synthetase